MEQVAEKTHLSAFGMSLAENRMLEGKVALITGSNKGIGGATARLFALQGAKVIVNGRNAEDNRIIVDKIRSEQGEAISIIADVTKKAEVDHMVKEIVEKYGSIDILVNNAGTSRDALIHKTTDKNLWDIFDINLKAAHLCTQAVLPYFRAEERGHEFKKIVNLSSITGVTGNFGQANYGMSKAGLIAYSKACAREFARDRISVNVVAPGFTETQMTAIKTEGSKLGMPESLRNLAISCTPFARDGHAGQSLHQAGAILFFCSPLSDWITGQVIVVGGGMYI